MPSVELRPGYLVNSSDWGPDRVDEMIEACRDFVCPYGGTLGDIFDQTPRGRISQVLLEEKVYLGHESMENQKRTPQVHVSVGVLNERHVCFEMTICSSLRHGTQSGWFYLAMVRLSLLFFFCLRRCLFFSIEYPRCDVRVRNTNETFSCHMLACHKVNGFFFYSFDSSRSSCFHVPCGNKAHASHPCSVPRICLQNIFISSCPIVQFCSLITCRLFRMLGKSRNEHVYCYTQHLHSLASNTNLCVLL